MSRFTVTITDHPDVAGRAVLSCAPVSEPTALNCPPADPAALSCISEPVALSCTVEEPVALSCAPVTDPLGH